MSPQSYTLRDMVGMGPEHHMSQEQFREQWQAWSPLQRSEWLSTQDGLFGRLRTISEWLQDEKTAACLYEVLSAFTPDTLFDGLALFSERGTWPYSCDGQYLKFAPRQWKESNHEPTESR